MKRQRILTIVFCTFLFLFTVLTLVLPKSKTSANEKRVLAEFPKLSWEAVSSGKFMSQFDTYVADHFAFRDKWVGVYSYACLFTGRNGGNGVYAGADGYLISAPAQYSDDYIARRSEANLRSILAFAENNDVSCTLIVVPSTGYTMNDKLPKLHKTYYDKELFERIETMTSGQENFRFCDLRASFNEHKNTEQLYYKTDHHITSSGALLVYNEFCRSQGISAESFETVRTIEDFYGTSYSKSGLWLKKPDTIDIYVSTEPSEFKVTIGNEQYDSLFFEDRAEGQDKYEVFLGGNHPLTVIENQNNKNGQKLLIIKDSFSHCFATMLAENYETIVMVDLRYYRESTADLLEDYGINNVLFLYGAENMATSTDFGWLNY